MPIKKAQSGENVIYLARAEVWERLHVASDYGKDQGKILVIVDSGSDWIEVFSAGYRT